LYAHPVKADLDRNLSTLFHAANHKARDENNRLITEFAGRGMERSTSLISAVMRSLDTIHQEAFATAMPVLCDFAKRMQWPVAEIATLARPHLENLSNSLLAGVPQASFPDEWQRVQAQYALVFKQRLDGALRDLEIGFIGGRSVVVKDSDRRAVILQRFYEARHVKGGFTSLPVDPSASEEERLIAANICRQLDESGLIDWKGSLGPGIDGAGRITSRGIDVIEGNASPPIAITIDSRQYSVHGSSNVQIGEGNAQDITIRADKVIAAIDHSQATDQEKEKARSIVQSILASPFLTKIFGWVTGSPE
jgi:hypothetical protein